MYPNVFISPLPIFLNANSKKPYDIMPIPQYTYEFNIEGADEVFEY